MLLGAGARLAVPVLVPGEAPVREPGQLPHQAAEGAGQRAAAGCDLGEEVQQDAPVARRGQTGDDVVPAWSPDGTRIAYVGTGAFFTVDVSTREVRTCAQGQDFFFGDVLWLR